MQRKWRKTLSSHRLFRIYWEVISSMIVVILSILNGTLEFGSIEPRSTSWIAVIYTNRHEQIPSVILFGKIWTPCPLGVKCIDNRLGEWLDLYQGQVTEVVVWVVCVLVTLVAVDVIDEVTLVKVTWHWATHFPPTKKLQDFVQFPPQPSQTLAVPHRNSCTHGSCSNGSDLGPTWYRWMSQIGTPNEQQMQQMCPVQMPMCLPLKLSGKFDKSYSIEIVRFTGQIYSGCFFSTLKGHIFCSVAWPPCVLDQAENR